MRELQEREMKVVRERELREREVQVCVWGGGSGVCVCGVRHVVVGRCVCVCGVRHVVVGRCVCVCVWSETCGCG